ncbi:hypothetical protein [Stutzerimonas stutzeri]|uniref:hypothetical protein n=1 Tax=Stutzerimonas stutzeri TaxID=316 RepID=UPI0015E2D274|nr:hypothetical protein [Stutzerimonas stutzeri]MBA1280225.1 hypothetical protein [Stutzerimonas stutzeri]
MAEVLVGTVHDALLFGKLMTGGWFTHPKLRDPGMSILRRARFTCESCGFVSRPSKEIPHGYMLPVDRNHAGQLALSTRGECLCSLCASSLGLNWSVTGIAQAEGLIQVPGILIAQSALSQVEINRIALHVISVLASKTTSDNSPIASAARDIDAAMTALNDELGANIPFYRGKDSDFARALALIPDNLYEQRQIIIGQLRWWPNVRFWRQQGAYWMQATYKGLQDKDENLQGALAR